MDQGSTMKRSAVHNFAPTVTTFCVMWEGQALPHDTKFGNSRCEIVGRRVIFIWSLIHGLRWSGLIKAEPEHKKSANCVHDSWNVLCGSRQVMMTSSKWKHFPRYWPFVQGIHRSPVNSPHRGQWRGALICAWINGWVNNLEEGDLRRHRVHHDVIVKLRSRDVHRPAYVIAMVAKAAISARPLAATTLNPWWIFWHMNHIT